MNPTDPRWLVPEAPSLRRHYLRSGQYFAPSVLFGSGRIVIDLFWARNCLFQGLSMLGLASGQTVLVPGYICRSVPEAILAYGAHVEFYRVNHCCELDLEDIERRIRPGVGAVLAVHYFGSSQPEMRQLRELCDRRGLFLIEDCAHTLPGAGDDARPGHYGHISVFSWRKFLPVYDGATLSVCASVVQQRPRLDRSPFGMQLRSAKDVVDRWRASKWSESRRREAESESMRPVDSGIVNVGESGAVSAQMKSLAALDPNGDRFLPESIALPMTWASSVIRGKSDLAAVTRARRSRWLRLLEATRDMAAMKPRYGELRACDTPWVFPVRFDGVQDAHIRLRKRGIPAATWGGVRPLLLSHGEQPEAEELYKSLVFLPVHQDLTDADLTRVITALREEAAVG